MTAAEATRAAAPPENLETVIEAMRAQAIAARDEEGVSVGKLLAAAGRRSYGPLLAVIGLFAVSPATLIPGMTWLTAAVTFLVAGQMALGLQRPWLPRQLRDAHVPARSLSKGLAGARPWAQRVDRYLRPRFEFLAKPPFANLVALACIGAALITIPLGLIPLAPVVPSVAILLFGLGIAARDGLLLALGLGLSAGAGALVWPVIF